MDYKDHNAAVKAIRDAQGTQRDMRTAVREAHHFVDKRDGQWEPDIITRMRGKPRYTDDRTNPIVNQIAGELENAEFSIKVKPAGGDATKYMALVRDGLIRNIRNLSNADYTFSQAGRKMVKGGLSGWLISHDYYDHDSFDQDLLIEPIHDFHERVWLDPDDLTQDGSDAKWGVVLHHVGKDQYQDRFPNGTMKSLGNDQWNQAYYYKPESITIGHMYYIEETPAELLLMSDGRVLRANEATEQVLDELEAQGITIEDTREVMQKRCMFRMLDAGGWLSEPEETVFDCVPIVPVYGNFEVTEGKILYRGAVEKLMDMQRVHNYAISRYVEEVALAPRKKIFMTPEQAKGHEESIKTMNTNMNPVQFYNNDGESPPPFEGGAPNVNAQVQTLIQQTDDSIARTAGLFAANMGDNANLQSGVAIQKQIDRGNNGTNIYFEAMECAIRRTGEILNKTIPYVYDATRQVRLLKEDNTYEMAIMNQVVIDEQTGKPVTLNDLTAGKYDITCDVGASFKSRQDEANELFARAMEKDPSLMTIGGDLWMKNINAPSMDKLAERLRAQALNNGMIPLEQMTPEEQQAAQEAAAQPQQPSIEEMQMQIAQMQAQTQQLREQNIAQQNQIKMQELQIQYAGQQEKTQSKLAVDSAKIDQTQQRIDLEAARLQLDAQSAQFKQLMDMQQLQLQKVDSLANTVKNLSEAIGGDAVLNGNTLEAFDSASESLNNTIEE